jgi:F-type H+-transporting ATPase subunit delta
MLELVRGYAMATFDAAERDGRIDIVASDLAEMSRLLVRSEELREVVTDGSIAAQTRRAVLEDLLESKVSPEALAPFVFAVLSERAAELPKTLERLVEIAEVEVARVAVGEAHGAETSIGRSGAYERIRGYGERIFEQQPTSDDVDEIEDELFRLARIAEQNVELRQALADSASPIERRLAVLADLLENRVTQATAMLAGYVMRAGRSRDFVGALDYLVQIAAAERGRRVADIRAAVELDESERERLALALSRIMRRQVELRVRIDPSVLGGVSISVGDTVIDGTVRHRLEQLRESLMQRGQQAKRREVRRGQKDHRTAHGRTHDQRRRHRSSAAPPRGGVLLGRACRGGRADRRGRRRDRPGERSPQLLGQRAPRVRERYGRPRPQPRRGDHRSRRARLGRQARRRSDRARHRPHPLRAGR